MEKETKRDYFALITLLWLLCLIVACTDLALNHCHRPIQKEPTDSLQTENLEIKRRLVHRKHRTEQAKAEIPKAQRSAQIYYDTIIVYAPDTCLSYLSNYKALRDSTEQLLLFVVASQDSTIRDQETIIRNDSTMLVRAYKSVEDTVKYYKKEVRRRGFKRIIQAGVAGIVGGLIIGNQFRK